MQKVIDNLFKKYPRKSIRALELIPPFISLFLISALFWGPFVVPLELAYLIIFFDVYWLYKSINFAVCLSVSSKRIEQSEKEDWIEKLTTTPAWQEVRHVVIVPNYKEKIETLRRLVESIKAQTFPKENIFIFLAMEGREKEAKDKVEILVKEYSQEFGGILATFHPDNRKGEVAGKSSNQAHAARKAYSLLVKRLGFDINYLTVSSVDADAVFDRQYFALLTHKFLTSKNPHLTFFQSANVSYNNFFDVPILTRIVSFFGSLWRISLLVQGLKLIPNSTYSLSFKLLKEIGFWDTDVIPEDYRIFFKAFFKNNGKVDVEPIYLKTSMDCPRSHTYFKSLLSKFNQERRWSWGVSDDAYYMRWWLTTSNVPFFKKTYLVGVTLFDHILWPVYWYFITISANLVLILNPIFKRTSIGYSLPGLSALILTLCLLPFLVMLYVDYRMRIKNLERVSKIRKFIFPLEFLLMPISGFFLSALPALISHLQLVLGKRLEYKVTEKI